jgi:type VI secretion system secreted protein VgrG
LAQSVSSSLQALLAGFSQDTRLLQLFTPLGANKLLAECVRGEEGLSSRYSFTISALSLDARIGLKSLIGQPALLQLLTAKNRFDMRPFHGHITAVESSGANGGLARYQLTIEPWTAFLVHGRDSRVFQDMTVFDILDAVFGAWQGKGRLAPAWRFDIADRSIYPVRSLTTQYQESDLDFALRLMSEEGLFHFFEHSGAPDSPSLGSHTMVIADHNGAFQPNAQASIRFTQPGAVMKEDSIDRWRTEMQLQTNGIELLSWDYRTLDTRPVAAIGDNAGMPLVHRDAPGAYAYETRAQGQRMAENLLQALEARHTVHTAAGTVRTLSPGTTFTLHGQAQLDALDSDDARTFLVVRAVHLMHNNLSAEIKADIDARLSASKLELLLKREHASNLHSVGKQLGERPLYRNRIDASASAVPYRSASFDEDGNLYYPHPTVRGQQTAIVVGPPGAVVHTDRDNRIKVQFHWQRGAQSHSRLEHPAPDGHTGAPGDDTAGTWVRVLAPVAGANWGGHATPRVGQEVVVDFVEGDIDRPVVIATVYNGKGNANAQHNQVSQGAGAATGNAPAWFPGESGAHAHPAVLSGFKTQAMSTSQSGTGAYSQLVFDDSPGQPRVALQRHASPHQGTAELNMGHLRHQTDNQRLQAVGFGAELKTEHAAALRAGQGMLLSSDARANASGSVLDSREAKGQIDQAAQLQATLATTAQKHNAQLKDDKGQAEPAPEKLPAIAQMAHSANVLDATASGSALAADAGGQGKVTAYSEAQLQLSSPAGIVATTPTDTIISAGNTSSITAERDINFAAQGSHHHVVKGGISLFSYGKAVDKDRPNQETGIRLHSASGKVSMQSQSDETRITADKAVTVASTTKSVSITAKDHVLLAAQGAYIKLEGGNIMIHGPGTMAFKAGKKELGGPANGSFGAPPRPKAKEIYNEAFVVKDEKTGEPLPHVRYLLESESGVKIEGVTDAEGRVQRLFSGKPEQLKTFLPDED